MTPQGRIAPEACFIGIRAEGNACESNTGHASRFLKPYLQQKNGLLTKDRLRQNCILEEVCGKHFTTLPLEHFYLLCSVSGAKKEALAISGGNRVEGRLGRPQQVLFRARSVAAQGLFDLAPHRFDGVEIRRIRR